jgi:glycosyltransferase involved in cell wall biosynthesis
MNVPSIDMYRTQLPQKGRIIGGRRQTSAFEGCVPALVSVITVSFNSCRTIKKTIDSVAAQSYPLIEYIVIDGGSTDGTVELLKDNEARIDFWVSEPDHGISDAFNKGIALASGEFISMLNSDDWMEPQNLQLAIRRLRETDATYVFGDLALHSPEGDRMHFFTGDADYQQRIAHIMPFLNHPTVVCRRKAFEAAGLFDVSLRTAMDYDWFLRLHKLGCRGVHVPGLVGHMTLEGQSDKNFSSALKESRDISIRYGYPWIMAWVRYGYRLSKGHLRRRIKRIVPAPVYEQLRRSLNKNYKNDIHGPE